MVQDDRKPFFNYVADKHFIYGPEPEIYGGLAGFYTYGPLGKRLKNNVENVIRDVFTQFDFWEVECPTVMPKIVWEASGHLGGFTDPLIKDEQNNIFRADKLIEEWCAQNNVDPDSLNIGGLDNDGLLKLIEEKGVTSPKGKKLIGPITNHNLMMRTTIGHDVEAYNRPETATTTYLPFLRYVNFFREKLPFGVFQIGKAYRNEISPRQHVLRCREFTQAEGQLFIFPTQKNEFDKYELIKDIELPLWYSKLQQEGKSPEPMSVAQALEQGHFKNKAYAWTVTLAYQLFASMGIPAERIRMRQHHEDEKAFYADDAWDVELQFASYGWTEVCGIHDRTSYDLETHAKFSKAKLSAINEQGERVTPHIIEIAFGTDRPTLALLDIFYNPGKEGESKPSLDVPYHIAPVQVAVFPLQKKDGIPELALKVYASVQKQFSSQYDQSGSVGKRYLRQDEIGTPFCITVDYDSLEHNDVTVRDRNTKEQMRVKVDDLVEYLKDKLGN